MEYYRTLVIISMKEKKICSKGNISSNMSYIYEYERSLFFFFETANNLMLTHKLLQ